MIGTLAALDALGAVALVVDGERVPVRVTEHRHENREILVRAIEREENRRDEPGRPPREFRVYTEWAAGWLPPAVGVRTDSDDVFCPAAGLDAIETDALTRPARPSGCPPRGDARPSRE